jgi:hypothetical protein
MSRATFFMTIALMVGTYSASAQAACASAKSCEEQILEAERTKNMVVFRELLSDKLVAIGPDGRRHSRQEMLDLLQAIPPQPVTATDFVQLPAGDNAVIVNYLVSQPTDAGTRRHVATSVWVSSGKTWTMIFHQGTAIPEGGEEPNSK